MTMEILVAFSPCPNDTFIFYALVHNKINTEGLVFKPVYADVETLNTCAMEGKYLVTKLSYHAYAYASAKYQILHAGSALGKGCGPILISKDAIDIKTLIDRKIIIPGKYTTANLLLSLAFPFAKNKVEMVFSEIEGALLKGVADAGVIIHENRFTYAAKGLKKITDLGEYWETTYQLPIPLGGIAVHRTIENSLKLQINKLLKKSVKYAMENPEQTMEYVRSYSQEMEDSVIQQHIQLYVNNYSIDLGSEGMQAIEKMYAIAEENDIIPKLSRPIFIN